MNTNPLTAISAPVPNISGDRLRQILQEDFGLRGKMTPLVSERDQNLRLDVDAGQSFVVKIANAAEDPIITDFQVSALQHLERVGVTIGVPRIRPTVHEQSTVTIRSNTGSHVLRVVSYIPGRLIRDTRMTQDLAQNLGRALAQLGKALSDFQHQGDRQPLLWDMQRAPELQSILHHISDPEVHEHVSDVLEEFEAFSMPVFAGLRQQTIHNDANPANVVVDQPGVDIAGFIDFGDMVRAPLIVDVAIAAAYLRAEDDPMQFIVPFVKGYDGESALLDKELELMFNLVCTRLATTIAILFWRLAERDDQDAYRQQALQSEADAFSSLRSLLRVGRDAFNRRMQQGLRR